MANPSKYSIGPVLGNWLGFEEPEVVELLLELDDALVGAGLLLAVPTVTVV